MEPRLVQSQSQKLILSPQIRQYLKLLQLPLAQLSTAIEQELEENPALEEVPKDPAEEASSSRLTEEGSNNEPNAEELRFDETLRSLDRLDENLRDSLYGQEDLSLPETGEIARQKNYQETLVTRKESLFDYLLWQIGFLDFNENERKIADEVIGNLTEEGYLGTPLEEIAKNCGVTPGEAEKILREIQGLDPPGIAARNLQETLLLQLARKGPEADLARKIVREYLPLLEKKLWDQIAKQVGAASEAIRQATRLIAHLDPKPGRTFYSEDPIAITPDASVYYDGSEGPKLMTEIYDEELPKLRVSSYYRRLLKDPKLDPASRRFLKGKIQSAIDFVKALAQRGSTLGGITEEIVRAQPDFFENGFSHLKPLRLKDISAQLGIHESTVSRAIQGKYLSTPQGTLPYKSFFSSKLERTEGGAESQKSMMEKIRERIRNEDSNRPLSDQELTEILQRDGIKIARRTVAKYRELLKILPSHLRRRK